MKEKSRRQFLKGAVGSLSGMIAAHFAGLFPEVQPLQAAGARFKANSTTVSQTDTSELYAGFLLLPEGAEVPSFVRYPSIGIPKFCGVGEGASPTVTTSSFTADTELANNVYFPVYTIKDPPIPLKQQEAYITRHSTGEIYSTTLCYSAINAGQKLLGSQVFLWAYPSFPQPYPLWHSEPVETDGPFFSLEQVDSLPQPGLMSTTPQGFVFYWIENGVFYTVTVVLESSPDIQDAQAIIGKLVLI